MRRILIATATLLTLAGAASAQTGSNVVGSSAESQVDSINRSVLRQQQTRSTIQQNQFETNSLRSQIGQPTGPATTGSIGLVPPPGARR